MSEEAILNLAKTLPGVTDFEARPDGWWMDAPTLDVTALARLMLEQEARLSTMTACMLANDETEVIYHYVFGKQAFNFRVKTCKNQLPSITPVTAAADWIEREISDLYAVLFVGHPNPARLIRPAQLAAGYFREPGGAAGKALREQH